MDTNRIVHIAANAGRIILENGGETYRAEETINRLCNSYDLIGSESFVTPTIVIVSASSNFSQTISIIKRINYREINLEKIAQINNLSRNIKNLGYSLEAIETELARIDSVKPYDLKFMVLASSIAAGCLTMVFGGNVNDMIVSAFAGGLMKLLLYYLSSFKANDFFINIFGGFFATLIALICVSLNLATNLDKVIIGSLMLLVPGLAITNAIRDTIAGDLISGIMMAVEAFLIAIAVAVGSGIVFKIWFSFFGGL